jgi:membrane protease YdiL (CAAX protease family)
LIFFQNPYLYFHIGKSESFRQRLLLFRNTFIFCLGSSFIIVLLITLLESSFNISIVKNLIVNRDEFRLRKSHWMAFVKTSVVGPFEEEFLFRFILVTKSWFLRCFVFLGWLGYFARPSENKIFFDVE